MKAYLRSGVTVVAAILAAAVISLASPPSYSAGASVYLARSPDYSGTKTSAVLDSERFASAIALSESDALLGPVAAAVNLPMSQVREMATETPHPDSTILDINVISSNPDTAATVSNAIATTMSSIAGTTDDGFAAAASVVKTATPPTSSVPISWPTVISSGLLAGAIIALTMTIAGRAKPTPKTKSEKEHLLALP